MRHSAATGRAISLALVLALAGCAHLSVAEDEQMLRLGSELTKLAAAVESAVRYKNPPDGLDDAELLAFATQHDPSLLAPVKDYTVRVLRQDRHAVVLVCTQDRRQALLEDAGCTGKLDRQAWRENPRHACEFSVEVSRVCSGQ